MNMRFTLNDEYKDVKGVVNCGKFIVNLDTDVTDGVYESDVPQVQQTLSELRGGSGRVFNSEIVKEDGTTAPVSLAPIPGKPPSRDPTEVAAQLEGKAEAEPQAPNVSGYDALPDSELETLIKGKGLPLPDSAEHAELVEILDSSE